MGGELGFTTPTSAGWIASGMQLQHAHASQKAALPLAGCRPGAMPGQGLPLFSAYSWAQPSARQHRTAAFYLLHTVVWGWPRLCLKPILVALALWASHLQLHLTSCDQEECLGSVSLPPRDSALPLNVHEPVANGSGNAWQRKITFISVSGTRWSAHTSQGSCSCTQAVALAKIKTPNPGTEPPHHCHILSLTCLLQSSTTPTLCCSELTWFALHYACCYLFFSAMACSRDRFWGKELPDPNLALNRQAAPPKQHFCINWWCCEPALHPDTIVSFWAKSMFAFIRTADQLIKKWGTIM